MISSFVKSMLAQLMPEELIFYQEPLNKHTSFRVGGEADCLIQISSMEQLKKVTAYLNQIEYPYFILGNGSNVLVSDDGYRGFVLKISDKLKEITVDGDIITAQAGALLSGIAATALKNSLTGFEFAAGIPGTIGGAVVMNAGAYGGEMKQIVKEVHVLDRLGQDMVLDNVTMDFGYRTSAIRNHRFVVTKVKLQLIQGTVEAIKENMEQLAQKRRAKQPLEFPSAGSTFKRPEGHFAGELIMKAGLRGLSVGGAQVSEKHCGFIINKNKATAQDIFELIEEVQERVYERSGIRLEPEVVLLGEFTQSKMTRT